LYLVFTVWVLVYSLLERRSEALLGLGTIALGLVAYLAAKPKSAARGTAVSSKGES